jgi:hypothetical protein
MVCVLSESNNDMRSQFFGPEASTQKTRDDLIATIRSYEHHNIDIRHTGVVTELFDCGLVAGSPLCGDGH